MPTISQCVSLACALEVIAPKPGNVHRSADFETTTLQDFVVSAIAIGPVFDSAQSSRIGELVLRSVEATGHWVGNNTNLGLVLLLAPLAKAATSGCLDRAAVKRALAQLDHRDARDVYAAIRLARPGGLGSSPQFDVRQAAPGDLLAAMSLAAERDMVARQYVNDFEQVFEFVAPRLAIAASASSSLADAIVMVHLQTLAAFPDSLIARKCGIDAAEKASIWAGAVLEQAADGPKYHAALSDLDFWLRADGNRRNPGTTADLIGAGLFVALRNGMIKFPLR